MEKKYFGAGFDVEVDKVVRVPAGGFELWNEVFIADL